MESLAKVVVIRADFEWIWTPQKRVVFWLTPANHRH